MDSISILVVEDEALVQIMVEDALKEAGSRSRRRGAERKQSGCLDAPDATFRALVTDIHLADELTGWNVAKHARTLNPDFPIIYVTGGGADEWASQGVPNSILVPKPFAASQVVLAVSQLLNQGNTPGA